MSETKNKEAKDKSEAALSRRELLLTSGAAAVVSRFPIQTALLAQISSPPLPPGLYTPSVDHLTHALNSDAAFLPIPAGAETEYRRPASGPYVPQGLTAEEFALIRRLVEIILGEDLKPAGDSPPGVQGIGAELAEWIDLVVASAPGVRAAARNLDADHRALAVTYFGSEDSVRELETSEPERICHEGLVWLGQESWQRFAKPFLEAEPAQQVALVELISDARADKSAVHAGTRLFDFLKIECIRGFYTSRFGLKELNYKGNSFYSESPGCDLTPNSSGIRKQSD
jgi:Gluconate 2-dehydrogenase subunit 3